MSIQIAIAFLGGIAAWLSFSPSASHKRWAGVVGLASQPFWLIETYRHAQWGMFALALVYSASFCRGLWLTRHVWRTKQGVGT
jgi:hypothetical protein